MYEKGTGDINYPRNKVMTSPICPIDLEHLLVPANSPTGSLQLHQFIDFKSQTPISKDILRLSRSSSSNGSDKNLNITSKLLNPFNDTISSQSRHLNSLIKQPDEKPQLGSIPKNNPGESLSNLPMTPLSFFVHNLDGYSRNCKMNRRPTNLSSSPRGISENTGVLKPLILGSPFSKNFSGGSQDPTLLNSISSPSKLKNNATKMVSPLLYGSPSQKKERLSSMEIDRAFLTSEPEDSNDIYSNLFGSSHYQGLRHSRAIFDNTLDNPWYSDRHKGNLKAERFKAVSSSRSNSHDMKATSKNKPKADTRMKSGVLQKKDGNRIQLTFKKSDADIRNFVPSKISKKNRERHGVKKRSGKRHSKMQNENFKRNRHDAYAVGNRDLKTPELDISKYDDHVIASLGSDQTLFSLDEDMNAERGSDDEYVPGKYRQTRSKRKLSKTKQIDLDLEKKRRLGPRSKSGCWTCRVRHKACPEDRPVCSQCVRLNLRCDYSDVRPSYMTDPHQQMAKLKEIRTITSQQKKINFAKKKKVY
ncbi:uncharacterized protein PRCAT00001147001 [Priceomyces carsonii]|uniref:uncharacterized protein n=1 Tax=Priceomyces carsonii TaxID=28549 RepID=UPI002EDAC4B7|nr:unnamed protein product [Priceomyces carsonii]